MNLQFPGPSNSYLHRKTQDRYLIFYFENVNVLIMIKPFAIIMKLFGSKIPKKKTVQMG